MDLHDDQVWPDFFKEYPSPSDSDRLETLNIELYSCGMPGDTAVALAACLGILFLVPIIEGGDQGSLQQWSFAKFEDRQVRGL